MEEEEEKEEDGATAHRCTYDIKPTEEQVMHENEPKVLLQLDPMAHGGGSLRFPSHSLTSREHSGPVTPASHSQ